MEKRQFGGWGQWGLSHLSLSSVSFTLWGCHRQDHLWRLILSLYSFDIGVEGDSLSLSVSLLSLSSKGFLSL